MRLTREEVGDLLAAKRAYKKHRNWDAEETRTRSWMRSRRIEDAVRQAAAGAHAIGIGRKVTNGKTGKQAAIRVYVTEKLPRSRLSPRDLVNSHVDGIPTDVVEAPVAYFAAIKCSSLKRRRQRPLIGGVSAANAIVSAGTLGMLCRSTLPGEGDMRLMLSNSHVLADFGAAPIGSAVLQPASRDGGEDGDAIGTLRRFVPIATGDGDSNSVDAAVLELHAGVDARAGVCTVGELSGLASVTLQARVHKHGRTTGYTEGLIDDICVDALVPMSRDVNAPAARFVDQIRIVPRAANTIFALAGDSGAVIALRNKPHAAGLLFSCPDDGSYALACPMNAVLAQLFIEPW